MADVTITPLKNGPYMVKGSFTVTDPEGKEFEVSGDTAYLCRCGGSSNKPFCDGTHSRIGFDADTRVQAR